MNSREQVVNRNLVFCFAWLWMVAPMTLNAQITEDPPTGFIKSDSLYRIDTITIGAYQFGGPVLRLPGSLGVVDRERLLISDGTSLSAALNTLPGVFMQNGTFGTGRLTIRGMGSRTPYNSNRIRAYLNDIPITGSDGISTPEEMDPGALARVEVVKGPASALYGSGLGGALNLRLPVSPEGNDQATVQTGNYNTFKAGLTATASSSGGGLTLAAHHLQSEGYRENSHYRRTGLLTTGGVNLRNARIEATLLLVDVAGGIPSSLGVTAFLTNPGSAAANWKAVAGFEKYRKGVVGTTLTHRPFPGWTHRMTLFGRWNDAYERRPFNNLDDLSLGGGIRGRFSYHTDRTDWMLGHEWLAEEYRWSLDLRDSLINRNRERRLLLNNFAMLYWRPAERLNVSLAAALNHAFYRLTDLYPADGDRSGGRRFEPIFSPRLGVNWIVTERLAAYASAGHGFSMPSPEETLMPEGMVNPDLRPETGYQFESGFRWSNSRGSSEIEATLYWIELKDLLTTLRLTEDVFTGINAGKTRHQGWELQWQQRWSDTKGFPGRITSLIACSGSVNRFVEFNDGGTDYRGKRLPGIPGEVLQALLSWQPLTRLELTGHLQAVGRQFADDANRVISDGYLLVNLKAQYGPVVKRRLAIRIFAGINNLTDAKYASMLVVNAVGFGNNEPRYYYPGLPRHGFAGIRISF